VLNYKYRISRTQEIKERLAETLGGCRWVYNYFYKASMPEFDMNHAFLELKENN